MSSRDIDSTSENVLHDWAARGESSRRAGGARRADVAEPDRRPRRTARRRGGRASVDPDPRRRSPQRRSRRSRTRTSRTPVEVDDDVPELDEGEIEETLRCTSSSRRSTRPATCTSRTATRCSRESSEGGRRAVGVVVSRFNGSVTTQLLDGALAELSAAGVGQEAITIMVVPGAFELPLAATALAKTRRFACIVALGCVIRGDTPHFDYVSSEAASGLQLAALETGVPVSFGVLTLDRVEQAEARVGKGAEAVRSALEMADLFAHLRAAAAAR